MNTVECEPRFSATTLWQPNPYCGAVADIRDAESLGDCLFGDVNDAFGQCQVIGFAGKGGIRYQSYDELIQNVKYAILELERWARAAREHIRKVRQVNDGRTNLRFILSLLMMVAMAMAGFVIINRRTSNANSEGEAESSGMPAWRECDG